jgi:hypothetical protein
MNRCSVYSKKVQKAIPSTNTPITPGTDRFSAFTATDSRNEITGT